MNPYKWVAQGDANVYAVELAGLWFCQIQLNGAMPVSTQEQVMDKIVTALNQGE